MPDFVLRQGKADVKGLAISLGFLFYSSLKKPLRCPERLFSENLLVWQPILVYDEKLHDRNGIMNNNIPWGKTLGWQERGD